MRPPSPIAAVFLAPAAARQDGVFNNGQSFVTFRDLATTETADANGGYGFHAQGGNNVTFLDCDASLAGKHHFADIDSTENLQRVRAWKQAQKAAKKSKQD